MIRFSDSASDHPAGAKAVVDCFENFSYPPVVIVFRFAQTAESHSF